MAKTVDQGSLPTTEQTIDNPDGTKTRVVNGGSYRAVYGKDDEPSAAPGGQNAGDKHLAALVPELKSAPISGPSSVDSNSPPLGGGKGGSRFLG